MTTQPKPTAAQKKERNELAKAFAVQIAGSTIIFHEHPESMCQFPRATV